MNTEYLTSIGEVIKKIGELRPTDVHRLQQMYNYGADVHKITNSLSAMSSKNIAEIYDIFDIVAKENYNFAKPFYKAKGMAFIPFEGNESLQKYVKAVAKQTAGQYVNLTQHTAFSVFAKDGKSIAPLFASNKHKAATSLSDTYTKVIDYAVSKVQFGGEGYNKAMRDVIKALASSGIKTVDYASGYSRRLDSAVRQNILWGVKECNQNTADMVGKEFGADGYEISYHSNPRPSHVEMGGRQYAIGRARTINGVHYPSFEKEAEPFLNEPNCLHFKFSILLGISQPAHDKDQLEQFKANDKKTFEFEGKKYTGYEGTQLQRRIENAVKNQKDLLEVAKAAGDKELEREARESIKNLTSKYHQLSKASGLPTKMERMGTIKGKSVDNFGKSGIIKERNISSRKMAAGMRKSPSHILSNQEIESLKCDIKSIGADESVFEFNKGRYTGYNDKTDKIKIRGDVLPDTNSQHPRDLMSSRAVIAHEYYGHRAFRGTKVQKGAWNDEFRASYTAAKNTPNLSGEDRKYLVLDAIERAKESGITIKNNDFIRRILYGY